MRLRLLAIWDSLRGSYWFIPTLMALSAIAFAYGLIAANSYLPSGLSGKLRWLYGGGPEGARSVLSTIAGSVVTVAGTTFSITIAALTLASSQFGPRLLRTFRRDTGNQIVLGTFISTFLYCLLVLRTVVGTDENQFVPDLAVTFGVLLAIMSLAVLIYFIHHTAGAIQVSNLMHSVQLELNASIVDAFPEPAGTGQPKTDRELPESIVPGSNRRSSFDTRRGGYLLRINLDGLIRYASRRQSRLLVHMRPGSFSIPGMPLATEIAEESNSAANEAEDLYEHFYFGSERTPEKDPEHAFLQLAEIAVRALSPGINDPFTAIACLDKIAESMVLLAERDIEPGVLFDAEHTARVQLTRFQYEELVVAAFQFIRRAAAGNREVLAHLSKRLTMVLGRTRHPDLRIALEGQALQTEEDLRLCPA